MEVPVAHWIGCGRRLERVGCRWCMSVEAVRAVENTGSGVGIRLEATVCEAATKVVF